MPGMGIVERKSRQKQALRERILDAARRIVVREGFAALSMRKIADAIEYSPATLYLHFASRDEIAQALCAEGYAQLLETFVPLAQIADPAERLKALGHAYVAFGVAHPETYRLIFMEDPSYTGAALGGMAAGSGTGVSVAPIADAGATDDAVGMPAAGAAPMREQRCRRNNGSGNNGSGNSGSRNSGGRNNGRRFPPLPEKRPSRPRNRTTTPATLRCASCSPRSKN